MWDLRPFLAVVQLVDVGYFNLCAVGPWTNDTSGCQDANAELCFYEVPHFLPSRVAVLEGKTSEIAWRIGKYNDSMEIVPIFSKIYPQFYSFLPY